MFVSAINPERQQLEASYSWQISFKFNKEQQIFQLVCIKVPLSIPTCKKYPFSAIENRLFFISLITFDAIALER
jgi:hypothetical protein